MKNEMKTYIRQTHKHSIDQSQHNQNTTKYKQKTTSNAASILQKQARNQRLN